MTAVHDLALPYERGIVASVLGINWMARMASLSLSKYRASKMQPEPLFQQTWKCRCDVRCSKLSISDCRPPAVQVLVISEEKQFCRLLPLKGRRINGRQSFSNLDVPSKVRLGSASYFAALLVPLRPCSLS